MNKFWKIAGIVMAVAAVLAAAAYFLPKLCPSCGIHVKVPGRHGDGCCGLADDQDEGPEEPDEA